MPLTRQTHYAALPRSPNARGATRDARTWTRDSAMRALALFVQDEGRLPRTRDLGATNGMPSQSTILHLFTSIDTYRGTTPRPTRPAPPVSPYAKLVSCPRCGKRWPSPDSRFERYCSEACRTDTALDADGQWMTGAVVTLKTSVEFSAQEVRAFGS